MSKIIQGTLSYFRGELNKTHFHIFSGGFGSLLAILRDNWLCSQELILLVLRALYEMFGIEPKLFVCKVNTEPAILYIGPDFYIYIYIFFEFLLCLK